MPRALTLHQPWSSLVVEGRKRFETRSWPTKHRGRLLIHAGAAKTKAGRELAKRLGLPFDDLPFGAIVGSVFVFGVLPVEDVFRSEVRSEPVRCVELQPTRRAIDAHSGNPHCLAVEILAGDFSPGRFAWHLQGASVFPRPIHCRGYQRLWNFQRSRT